MASKKKSEAVSEESTVVDEVKPIQLKTKTVQGYANRPAFDGARLIKVGDKVTITVNAERYPGNKKPDWISDEKPIPDEVTPDNQLQQPI